MCVKAVKANYAAIVVTLDNIYEQSHDNIYEQSHEPEALGISKALSKESTLSAIFLLDFVLSLVIKLSKCLQTENHISLVHATLFIL